MDSVPSPLRNSLKAKRIYKMVFRYYVKCETCDAAHTLRISVGHNNFQDHTFLCSHCKEEIKVRLDLDFEHVGAELKCVENCELSDQEGTIINLHPELPLPESELHTDFSFPWLNFTRDHFGMDKETDEKLPAGVPVIRDVHLSLGGGLATSENWNILKKSWSLYLNGKKKLSKEFLTQYTFKGYSKERELDSVIFHFSSSLLIPQKISLFQKAAKFIGEIHKKFPNEFLKFKKFYLDELYEDHKQKYFEIYSEYFKDFSTN